MQPWGAFIVGVLLSNLFQWGKSVSIQTTLKGKERWLGYWYIGLPHMVANILVDVLACVAWEAGWLDNLLALMPGTGDWANVGIPYTPQVGIMLGAGVDIFADQIAFVLRKALGSRLPFLSQPKEVEGDREGA